MREPTAILPFGRFQRISERGFLINECTVSLQPPWAGLVALFIEKCSQSLEPHLHSLYVRGSVARGTAIEGTSDLDALAVLADAPEKSRMRQLHNWLNTQFLEDYKFCSEVDLNFLDISVLLNSPRGADYRFMLKTQSICVKGTDLCPQLPDYRADRCIAFGCRWLPRDLSKFRQEFSESNDANRKATWCGWIMRKFLRVGGEIGMSKTGHYTRDLYPCCKLFGGLFPLEASRMEQALNLAINPSDDAALIFPLVDALEAALLPQVRALSEEI